MWPQWEKGQRDLVNPSCPLSRVLKLNRWGQGNLDFSSPGLGVVLSIIDPSLSGLHCHPVR